MRQLPPKQELFESAETTGTRNWERITDVRLNRIKRSQEAVDLLKERA